MNGIGLLAAALARATAEQIEELRAALADEDGRQDPAGMTLAWARIVAGLVDPGRDTAALPGSLLDRDAVALAIARRRGRVTARALAEACAVTPETARLALVRLAERGKLAAEGVNKGRYYVEPETVPAEAVAV